MSSGWEEIPPDRVEAFAWLALADSNGVAGASEELQRVKEVMSDDERRVAEERVRTLKKETRGA
jgi:hypothetical protein